MPTPAPRYAFYAKRYARSKASIRLRLLEPIAALRAEGLDVARYPRFGSAKGLDAVVISKAFGRGAQRVIASARKAGCALVFDICDNRFANTPRASAEHCAHMSMLLGQADIVTVPTDRMGQLLAAQAPAIADRVRVVPDMLDDMSAAPSGLSIPDRLGLHRLSLFLQRHPGALHCVWFGNNMPGISGVCQMGEAISQLRSFAERHPVTLTIISNKPALYRQASAEWGIPHSYMPWSLASFPAALRMHRAAIIPVPRNDYTAGKSINRPATAILAGLGVIADAIPAYEELRPFIALDDWQGGLERYAFRWNEDQPRLAAARAHLDDLYGRRRVAARWAEILDEAAAAKNRPR